MITIPLGRGLVALIDDCDAYLTAYSWSVLPNGRTTYAKRGAKGPDGKWTTRLLHRDVLGVFDRSTNVDHINSDGLDCRRGNLRIATPASNSANRRRQAHSSPYKGVSWHKRIGRWQVRFGGRDIHLGYFDSAEEAARVYDDMARREFGPFAALNFPGEGEKSA